MQRPAPILGPTTAENQTLMGFKGGSPELVPPYPGSRTSGMVVTAPPQSVKLYVRILHRYYKCVATYRYASLPI